MITPVRVLTVGLLLASGRGLYAADKPDAKVPNTLTIAIEPAQEVARVGVLRRFDAAGNAIRPVDPKAKFDAPYCEAEGPGARHTFTLKPGIYDVIVFLQDGTRLEGYHWPVFTLAEKLPAKTFAQAPPDEAADAVRTLIAAARQYENKVTPLALAGDDQVVRVLMQLHRDDPTSFDADFGAPVATLRYEIWQFRDRYGGWVRDKQSKVLHRLIAARSDLGRRTWLWDRRLGGITIALQGSAPSLSYTIPADRSTLTGLRPAKQTD